MWKNLDVERVFGPWDSAARCWINHRAVSTAVWAQCLTVEVGVRLRQMGFMRLCDCNRGPCCTLVLLLVAFESSCQRELPVVGEGRRGPDTGSWCAVLSIHKMMEEGKPSRCALLQTDTRGLKVLVRTSPQGLDMENA